MTEPILDPATERGIITRMTARNLVRHRQTVMMRAAYADPVADAIARGVILEPPTPADYSQVTDAAGSPRETFHSAHYEAVKAARSLLIDDAGEARRR